MGTFYGAPIAPYPGFSLLDSFGSLIGFGAVRFGEGIAMGAFLHMPFGWLGWGLDWFGHGILFNHAAYYSHSSSVAHWGGRGGWYGGRGGRPEPLRQGQDYLPGRAYAANRFTANASRGYGQGYQNRGYQQSYNRGYGQAYQNRGYAQSNNRGFAQNYQNRGYGSSFGNYARPAYRNDGNHQSYAYNRMPDHIPAPARQFTSSRPGYGSYGGVQAYAGRGGSLYGSSRQSWGGSQRMTAPRTQQFAQRSYSEPMSRSYKGSYGGRASSGGGFHMFGGGHASQRSFGGGRAFKAPRGGGGHFGGSHSGGGHSGGGHSGGGHSGGGGHHGRR